MKIREIKAGNTMFIIPNALDITIENNERLKIIIQGRNTWLTAIRQEVITAGQGRPSEGNTPVE